MRGQLVPKCWDPGYKHLSSFQQEEVFNILEVIPTETHPPYVPYHTYFPNIRTVIKYLLNAIFATDIIPYTYIKDIPKNNLGLNCIIKDDINSQVTSNTY